MRRREAGRTNTKDCPMTTKPKRLPLITAQKNVSLTGPHARALASAIEAINRSDDRLPEELRKHRTEGRELGEGEVIGLLACWLSERVRSAPPPRDEGSPSDTSL